MKSLVSIVIPVYNSEKFVKDSIQSVIKQTYKNIEIIVVDDGSTDNSANIIKSFKRKIEPPMQLKYFYQENSGPSVARNNGFRLSTGNYIALLDADDLYHPEKIKTQLLTLDNNLDVDVTYNDIKVVDVELNQLNIMHSEGNFLTKEDLLTNLLFRQIIPAPAGIMLRRKCIEEVQYNPNIVYAEDYDFLIRLAQKFTFKYYPGPYYIVRRHENNLTNNHKKQVESEQRIVERFGEQQIKSIIEQSSYDDETKKIMLAKILIKIKQYFKARIILESLANKTNNPYVYFYLGNIYFKEEKYYEALFNFNNAIKLNSDLAEVHNNLGCTLTKLGMYSKAKKSFEKSLSLRNNYLDAQYNLNILSTKTKECRLTIRELRKVLLDYEG